MASNEMYEISKSEAGTLTIGSPAIIKPNWTQYNPNEMKINAAKGYGDPFRAIVVVAGGKISKIIYLKRDPTVGKEVGKLKLQQDRLNKMGFKLKG